MYQNKQFFTSLADPPPGAVVQMDMTPQVIRSIEDAGFDILDGRKLIQ